MLKNVKIYGCICRHFNQNKGTMKKFLILANIFVGSIVFQSCQEQAVFAPDRLFLTDNGQTLLVANRGGKGLLQLDPINRYAVKHDCSFAAPVCDLTEDPNHFIWVVCEGDHTNLYKLSADLSVVSEIKTGHTPSSICYNGCSKSLWLTMRYNGELWEVDPSTEEVITKIAVGREPVDVVSFAGDSLLLVAGNLPETSSMAFPVAASLKVVDVVSKKLKQTIALPNGATDVKSIAVDKKKNFAYVTHLLARYQLPTNQVDRGWMSTNALSVVDLQSKSLLTTVLLDTPQKGAANPWEVTVSADDQYIVVAASGTHELVTVDRLALHDRLNRMQAGEQVTSSIEKWEDIENDASFLYGIREFIPTKGKGPRSVVIAQDGRAYTANYFTGEVMAVDLKQKKVEAAPMFGAPMISTDEGLGNMYFHDASIGFQGWQSCASCHPNEARADGLNWDLLNDGLGNPKNTKTLMLSHETPPCMISGIRKDAETAVRSGIKYILFAETDKKVAKSIDSYLKSLSPLSSPYLQNGNLSESALRGKDIFEKECASCHGGKYYTDLQQYAVSWTTGPDAGVRMDVPALREVWRTAPYLYDGRSYTMEEMLKIHGAKQPLSDRDRSDLAEYVLSL